MAAQVASKPSAERIQQWINKIFGPTEIISRKDGDYTKIFIPAYIVEALQEAKMKESLGLVEEERVLSHPNLRAFKV